MSEGIVGGAGPAEPDDLRKSLAGAKQGSQSDLGRLLEAFRPYLLAIANEELSSSIRPRLAASDCVANAILKAFAGWDAFEGSTLEVVRAWLKRILLHDIRDVEREHYGPQRDVHREQPEGSDRADSGQLSPSRQAIGREVQELVRAAISRLPEDYQDVINLRRFEGRAWEIVGEAMGRSAEAARHLYWRALDALEQELRRDGIRSDS